MFKSHVSEATLHPPCTVLIRPRFAQFLSFTILCTARWDLGNWYQMKWGWVKKHVNTRPWDASNGIHSYQMLPARYSTWTAEELGSAELQVPRVPLSLCRMRPGPVAGTARKVPQIEWGVHDGADDDGNIWGKSGKLLENDKTWWNMVIIDDDDDGGGGGGGGGDEVSRGHVSFSLFGRLTTCWAWHRRCPWSSIHELL